MKPLPPHVCLTNCAKDIRIMAGYCAWEHAKSFYISAFLKKEFWPWYSLLDQYRQISTGFIPQNKQVVRMYKERCS